MKLNRDILLIDIIKYKNVFYELLDYIDNHNGSFEFPEFLYIKKYNEIICNDTDQNIIAHLSLSSLLDNGIFIHNNKDTGYVSLEPVIVNTLRFIDITRIQELSHSDFEIMRNSIESIVNNIITNCNYGSIDYDESMISFNKLMSEMHGKIKQNVASLQYQVSNISDKYKQFDLGEGSISVTSLYDTVSNLYQRYVLPCFEFIDPKMVMRNKSTFSQSIKKIIEYHSDPERNNETISNSIRFRNTAITSYYKDIGKLVHQLEQYSTYLEKDRLHYLSIENAYNNLINSLVPLRHGKQKNKYLKASFDVFKSYMIFDGLLNHKSQFSPKIAWNNKYTIIRFNEHLRSNLVNVDTTEKNVLQPIFTAQKISEERIIEVSRLCFSHSWPKEINDIHSYLNFWLKSELNKYQLPDLLAALEAIFAIQFSKEFNYSETRKYISDNKYYLNYLNISRSSEHSSCVT